MELQPAVYWNHRLACVGVYNLRRGCYVFQDGSDAAPEYFPYWQPWISGVDGARYAGQSR